MKDPINYVYKAPEHFFIVLVLVCITFLWKSRVVGLITLVYSIAVLFFFRPGSVSSNIPSDSIICPADGKVLGLQYHKDKGLVQIALFLNVHNVHVQYAPISGKIVSQAHKDGKFHPAYMFKKSELNERTETVLYTDIGPVVIVQIAGLLARRIVSFHSVGTSVKQGEPMGLIKLGSRVDLYIPYKKISLNELKVGQRIRIGEVLATIKKAWS